MSFYASQVLSGAALNYRAVLDALANDIGAKFNSSINTALQSVTGTTLTSIATTTIPVEEDETLFGVFNANIYCGGVVAANYGKIEVTVDGLTSDVKTYFHNVIIDSGFTLPGRGATAFCATVAAEGKIGDGNVTLTAKIANAAGAAVVMKIYNTQFLTLVTKKQKYNDRIFT